MKSTDRIEQLNFQETELREKIQKLPRKKWNVLKLVFISLLLIFGLPFVGSRRFGGVPVQNNIVSIVNQMEAGIVISIIVIPIIIFGYLWNIDREIKKLEMDLEKVISEKNGL